MRYASWTVTQEEQSWAIHSESLVKQVPDEKTGNERVDAVVVDEEAIGSVDRPGCGAKILRGDGALDQYITRTNVMNLQVWYLMSRNTNTMISLGLGDQDHIYFLLIFIFVISLVELGLKWSFPFALITSAMECRKLTMVWPGSSRKRTCCLELLACNLKGWGGSVYAEFWPTSYIV